MTDHSYDSLWPRFWIFEVLILTVPLFVAILSLPRDGYLSHRQLAVLGVVVLALTILNAFVIRPKLSVSTRRQYSIVKE